MAGILNNKERVMDFIMTQTGKRQAGHGEMRVRYATFTDLHTFYDTSGSLEIPELASDASDRLFFEAFNRYQDTIVPELDAGYSLRPFKTKDLSVAGGTLISGTIYNGTIAHPNILSGSALTGNVVSLLNGITENFADQRIVGSIDEFSLDEEIVVTPVTGTFDLSSYTTFLRAAAPTGVTKVENIPSVFQDRRFSEFPNFKYLPPINKPIPGASEGVPMGNYPRFNEAEILTLDELEDSLADTSWGPISLNFEKTSRNNNLVIQFFEASTAEISKLSVVDFGNFGDDDPTNLGKRVFYVGKIIRDDVGVETFMCIFTVVIE